MLNIAEAKKIVHESGLSNRDQLLTMLGIDPVEPLEVHDIRSRCIAAGLGKLAKKNISDVLGKANGHVAKVPGGWELQSSGIERVQSLASAVNVNLVVSHSSKSLRVHVDGISDPLTKSFAMEAVQCFEAKQFRAAVVFSWAGAIALLHKHVFTTKLSQFNAEATRIDPKWRSAKQQDDLGRKSEHDFLNICESIGVIGKNVKLLLQNECLTLRNTCGHPNSAAIAENSVAAHIEKLIKNVYSRF